MDHTTDDVTRIVGEYAIALRERRLVFSVPQREVLEEVLYQVLCGEKSVKEKQALERGDEKLSGAALVRKVGSSTLTQVMQAHVREVYGKSGRLE